MQFLLNSLLPTARFGSVTLDYSEVELAPGVLLERRMVLGGGLGALALLFNRSPRILLAQDRIDGKESHSETERIELETLISNLRPEARRLVSSQTPDEESYIRLAIEELTKISTLETNRFTPSHKEGWDTDFQAYIPPLLLYQIRMSPNSVIDLHDHRYHNGALSVREGTVRVRSFDIYDEEGDPQWDVAAGKVPEVNQEFLIQEKGEVVLKQGQAAGLTRTRENIHQVEAGPDGSLLYDLFTNFRMNAQSFEIKWDGKYSEPSKKLCKVTWIPPDHSHD
jgi:hypothetical protein